MEARAEEMAYWPMRLQRMGLVVLVLALPCLCGCTVTKMGFGPENGMELRILPIRHIPQRNRNLCGPTAVSMVLEYWGENVEPEEVARETSFDPDKGITVGDIRQFFKSKRFHFFAIQGSSEDIMEQIRKGRPVLLLRLGSFGRNHLEVVIGYAVTSGALVLDDPGYGVYVLKREEFNERLEKAGGMFMVAVPESGEDCPRVL